MKFEKFKDIFKNSKNFLWWLDIIIPLLLCAIMFSGVSYLIYSGPPETKISSKVEKKLINLSLIYAGERQIKKNNEVFIINITPEDLRKTENEIDLHSDQYAKLLQILDDKKIRNIFLKWEPGSHTISSYNEIIEVVKNLKHASVTFGLLLSRFKEIPSDVKNQLNFLDSSTCTLNFHSVCSFKKEWNDWMFQNLIETFWSQSSNPPDNIISDNLPTVLPSYILYLNSPRKFTQYTYSDFFKEKENINLEGKSVFIGLTGNHKVKNENENSYIFNTLKVGSPMSFFLPDSENIKYNYDRLTSVLTPLDVWLDARSPKPTPHHIFWAQTAQQFIDNDLIQIASETFATIISIIFALAVIFSIVYLGSPISLGLFMVISVLVAFINGLMIHFFSLYIPIFNVIFAGASAFLFTSFGKLSLNALQSWRLSTQEGIDAEVTHLKENFISLISHNLNTPISKMQGTLDLLNYLTHDNEPKNDIIAANSNVAKIQLCIKTVLISTALNEKTIHNSDFISIKQIESEFLSTMIPIINRMNFNTDINWDQFDELNQVPINISDKVIVTFLGCIANLSHQISQEKHVSIDLQIVEKNENTTFGNETLRIDISLQAIKQENILEALLKNENQNFEDVCKLSIDQEVFIKLIHSTLKYYRGFVTFDRDQKQLSFQF